MELFHYHFWTTEIEETEAFYSTHGFEVVGRFALENYRIKRYDPPLAWDNFRDKGLTFRMIEMSLGQVRVTFGAGRMNTFGYFGYRVNREEHAGILRRAKEHGWGITKKERRTFLQPSTGPKIQLDRAEELPIGGKEELESVLITSPEPYDSNDWQTVLGAEALVPAWQEKRAFELEKVVIQGAEKMETVQDPNGVYLEFRT
ncbi:hypothetical protein [Marinococcus halotolerans]|uniref:hypothetical protein n=1 Tax=Marinococcus halotolerans TaxID=301092 RepID=UPI0003B484B2|nr:hypothetical protein [Marinococcus halotolerans]